MLDALVGMPLLGGVFGYVVPFLLLLTLVVFVHEMGHYLAARWRGIHSETVAVGFGPEIVGWTDAAGTRWRLCWIPIGGYVQFRGDTEPSSTGASPSPEPGSFAGAALLSRAIVVAAGPVMNFLFAAVIFALVAGIPGLPGSAPEVGLIDDSQMAADLGLQEGDRIERVNGVAVETAVDVLRRLQEGDGGPVFLTVLREGDRLSLSAPGRPLQIDQVLADSPAELAGLRSGDRILAINGAPVGSFRELQEWVRGSDGDGLRFEVERQGRVLTLAVRPELRVVEDPLTGAAERVGFIGVSRYMSLLFQPPRERLGPFSALAFGVEQTAAVIVTSLSFVGDLILGQGNVNQLGGPVAIAEFSGEAAQAGLWDFLALIAIISASIGLINLFPIPILDGGHLALYALEAVRGRPLGRRASRVWGWLGLSVIATLMVFVTYNDIARL